MLKAKNGKFFVSDWLRNRNIVEYPGIWERIHNPDFNYGEFAVIKGQAGSNSYKIGVKEWAAKTNAIGLTAKAGRYGGAYAHKDIAFARNSSASKTKSKNNLAVTSGAQWRAVRLLGQQAVAQLTQIPWGHNIAIISKCKNLEKVKLVWAEMT